MSKAIPHIFCNGDTQTEYPSYTAALKAMQHAVQAWRGKHLQQTARKYYSVLLPSGAYDERYPVFELKRKRTWMANMYIQPVSLPRDITAIIEQEAQDTFLQALDSGMTNKEARTIAQTVVNGHGYTTAEQAVATRIVATVVQPDAMQSNIAYCQRMMAMFPDSETWQRRLDTALQQALKGTQQ